MKFLQFTVASAVALIFSGAALTQSPGTASAPAVDPPQTLGALDADRDGSVSRAEASQNPGLAGQFATLDANGNGALEPAEFSRFETLGADSTFGAPGAPGSPGAPQNPAARSTVTPPPPMTGTPPPNTGTPPPDSSTPPPSTNSPPPG